MTSRACWPGHAGRKYAPPWRRRTPRRNTLSDLVRAPQIRASVEEANTRRRSRQPPRHRGRKYAPPWRRRTHVHPRGTGTDRRAANTRLRGGGEHPVPDHRGAVLRGAANTRLRGGGEHSLDEASVLRSYGSPQIRASVEEANTRHRQRGRCRQRRRKYAPPWRRRTLERVYGITREDYAANTRLRGGGEHTQT